MWFFSGKVECLLPQSFVSLLLPLRLLRDLIPLLVEVFLDVHQLEIEFVKAVVESSNDSVVNVVEKLAWVLLESGLDFGSPLKDVFEILRLGSSNKRDKLNSRFHQC